MLHPLTLTPSYFALVHICWPAPLSSLVLVLMTIRTLTHVLYQRQSCIHLTSCFSYISPLETSWVSHDLESDSSYSWLRSPLGSTSAELKLLPLFCHFCHPATILHTNLHTTMHIAHTILANNLALKFVHNTQDIASHFFDKLIFDSDNKLCQHTLMSI